MNSMRCHWKFGLLSIFAFVVISHSEEDGSDDEHTEDAAVLDDVFPNETHLTSEQLTHIHSKMDADTDGKVTLAEAVHWAGSTNDAGLRRDERLIAEKSFLDENDQDGDGKISLAEFLPHEDEEQHAQEDGFRDDSEARFKAADRNADGFLQADEIKFVLHPELHDEVITLVTAATLKGMDSDSSGQLSLSEFNPTDEPSLRPVFAQLDKDGDGMLNVQELKKFESGLFNLESDMNSLFVAADVDNDGHLTAKELHDARPKLLDLEAHHHFENWVHSEL